MSKLEHFMHDKTSLILLVVLMFVVGVTISQLVFKIDFEQIAKNAQGLTKEEAASQYAAREKAKIKQNGTDVELFGQTLNVVSVDISRTCKILNSTKCPNLNELIPFDTTNQKQIGKFIDGKRTKSQIKNPSIYFQNNDTFTVCVDCPFDIYKYSKHITVDLPFTYKDNKDRKVNNTRYEYHNRYEANCVEVRVAWLPNLIVNNSRINLVNDTINYLKSGCIETQYNEKVTIFTPFIKHDIKTTKQWQYDQWLKEAKKISKTENCIKSTKC